MNEDKVGKYICEIRKELNLTQSDLARKLSVTDKAVSKWETGKGFPYISLLIPLSDVLGVSVNELLLGERIKGDVKEEEILKTTINLSLVFINKWKRNVFYIVLVFIILLIFLLYVSESLSPIGVLEILTILIVLLCVKFKKRKSKTVLCSVVFLVFYTFYSFFTYKGSVRLEVFLMGHPIKAYTSKLELDTNRSWSKEKFYWVISDIRVISGSMGLVKCEDFYGFKVSSYYGF